VVCESDNEELALWDGESCEEGVKDLSFGEVELPVVEAATLLGLCLHGNPSFCGIDASIDTIQDERVGGGEFYYPQRRWRLWEIEEERGEIWCCKVEVTRERICYIVVLPRYMLGVECCLSDKKFPC